MDNFLLLEPIISLPKPDEVLADWTIYSQGQDESNMNLLVYASHRDFLSAPLTYTIISLNPNDHKGISETNVNLADMSSDLDDIPETGIYQQLEADNVIATVVVCGELIGVIDGQFKALVAQIYYAPDAKSALQEYLSQQEC